MLSSEKVQELRAKYPAKTEVVLIKMKGEPQMTPGLKGEVTFVDDAGQIHVRWENHSSLALVPGEDQFRVSKTRNQKIFAIHKEGSVEYQLLALFVAKLNQKNTGYVYELKNIYFDHGTSWWYTAVISRDPRLPKDDVLNSWQTLSPVEYEQVIDGDMDPVVQAIIERDTERVKQKSKDRESASRQETEPSKPDPER